LNDIQLASFASGFGKRSSGVYGDCGDSLPPADSVASFVALLVRWAATETLRHLCSPDTKKTLDTHQSSSVLKFIIERRSS
jgi:hypothetical protein